VRSAALDMVNTWGRLTSREKQYSPPRVESRLRSAALDMVNTWGRLPSTEKQYSLPRVESREECCPGYGEHLGSTYEYREAVLTAKGRVP